MNGRNSSPQQTTSTTTIDDKLSGQLIIKAQLGDDIRKMMIHNEDLTLNELVLMMERVFSGKISNSDELTIKYLDDDGDKITLLNDSDLTVALHFHKLLRLFVLVNGKEQINDNSTDNANKKGNLIDAQTFRSELQQIRNSVQTILDRLQLPTQQETTNVQEKETTIVPAPAIVSSTTREFDPYKHLQQKRSTTPDSIRSKSSISNKMTSNEQRSFPMQPSVPTVDSQQQQQQQQYHQFAETSDANKAPSTTFQQTQMPTPYFVPTGSTDQQTKTTFPISQSQYPAMPPLPNAANTRFPTSFPTQPLPNASATSTFNPSSAPPPSNLGQASTFIGQQQQQQNSFPPPPQQGGFYSQQQGLTQQRPGLPSTNLPNNTNNAFSQQQQQQQQPPTSSSSPATINPQFITPTAMPTPPPPLASQVPYGGYAPTNNFYNPGQSYIKPT